MNFGYKYQTAIRTRPLKFITSLGISSNNVYLPIGTVEGPLSVGGNNLSGKIEINLQQKFFALQPSLKIALELNGRWDLFTTATCLFDLGATHNILFKEQDSFFLGRKSAELSVNDPSVNLSVNSVSVKNTPLSIPTLFVAVGVTYRYIR